jgi:hypothetical protein
MPRYPNLQILVGTATLDSSFCDHLLKGDRYQAIAKFDLTEAEREVVLTIEANTITEFAQALLTWMDRQNGSHSRVNPLVNRVFEARCGAIK